MPDAPLLESIRSAVAAAASQALAIDPPAVPLAAPAQPEMGDLASPLAMGLAKSLKRPPREIAEAVADGLRARPGTAEWLAGVEVAGPGFLNMTLTPAWFARAAASLAAEGGRHGAGSAAIPASILLEFVSVNPTGPPHVGHARQAAYGDSLGRILDFAGHAVTREYYVNDYGRQMRKFGESVAARYAELFDVPFPVPEDGYHGAYVTDIAATIKDAEQDRFDAARRSTRRPSTSSPRGARS